MFNMFIQQKSFFFLISFTRNCSPYFNLFQPFSRQRLAFKNMFGASLSLSYLISFNKLESNVNKVGCKVLEYMSQKMIPQQTQQ